MRKDYLKQCLLEADMDWFADRADDGRAERAKKLMHFYKGLGRNRNGEAVTRWKIPSQKRDGVNYNCFIAVIPKGGNSLFAVAQGKKDVKSRSDAIRQADVKCFCSCPDFNWSGARYNMKHKLDSLEPGHRSAKGVPDGSDIAPTKRDPEGKNMVCKHLLAAFKGMKTNATVIMKDAASAKFASQPTPEETTADKEFFKIEKKSPKANQKANDAASDLVGEPATKPADNATDISQELIDTPPVKVEAAQEALDALAGAVKAAEPVQEEPAEDNKIPFMDIETSAALDEFGLETPEETEEQT